MPVTTRRRAAAIAANRTALKVKATPLRRPSATPLPPINTSSSSTLRSKPSTLSPPRNKRTQTLLGHARRKKSLPPHESHEIACRFGHRLYDGEAVLGSGGKATISPKFKALMDAGVRHQAGFYERKLAQVSADLAATGERELWEVHLVVEVGVGMLREILAGDGIGRG